jgi:hypothetical protein
VALASKRPVPCASNRQIASQFLKSRKLSRIFQQTAYGTQFAFLIVVIFTTARDADFGIGVR